MRRSDIWSGAGDFAGKPRPSIILQADFFETASVTVCGLTTNPVDAPLFRIRIDPDEENGLRSISRIMVDKIMTVSRTKVGQRIGRLSDRDLVGLNGAGLVFLGLIGSPRAGG